MDAITSDADWKDGEYRTQPVRGLRTAASLLLVAGSAPILWQQSYATRDTADVYATDTVAKNVASLDANDLLFQLASSRNYNPSPKLETIRARVMWVNSADDFINPPELAIAEREAKRLQNGTFVLLPASDRTRGHGSHTWAALWQEHLAKFLK